MWLTTPRMLVAVAVLGGLLALTAWAETEGRLSQDAAKGVYGVACVVLLIAIVYRARARWRAWKERQG